MSTRSGQSRRTFLKASAAASLAAPTIVSPTIFAKGDVPAPSDRVVVGSIGVGDLGRRHHLNNKLLTNPRIQVAAVCDVDRNHRDLAANDVLTKSGKMPGVYKDFRDLCDRSDIDAVVVVTPDHWHALVSIYAMETGKDVYCEKPLTLTIEEGKKMVEVARRYGTVFQTGSQQRSEGPFRQAVELIRNGKIGKLQRVDTYIGFVEPGEWQAPTTPPPELDWNMWLGPAPYAEYFPNRCHYQFRWFGDYSGGKLTDWGAHHNDITQWALDMDKSGPVKVRCENAEFGPTGPHDVALNFDIVYTYANGVELHCHSQGKNGVKFTGTDGWVFVSRSQKEFDAHDKSLLTWQAGENDVRLPRTETKSPHHDNWLNCIASRERPICDVEVGHRSATVCHLGNIATRLQRELNWDPVKEEFVGDDQANQFVGKPMRAPWHL
ncbi:MAG: Gfo/Idh/MocA family oxidoreductase [Planctomycetaceae bacterium]|nr:Gfo/Idh/MocA family oxidoreductase [Planctomycetaceae bacterium]